MGEIMQAENVPISGVERKGNDFVADVDVVMEFAVAKGEDVTSLFADIGNLWILPPKYVVDHDVVTLIGWSDPCNWIPKSCTFRTVTVKTGDIDKSGNMKVLVVLSGLQRFGDMVVVEPERIEECFCSWAATASRAVIGVNGSAKFTYCHTKLCLVVCVAAPSGGLQYGLLRPRNITIKENGIVWRNFHQWEQDFVVSIKNAADAYDKVLKEYGFWLKNLSMPKQINRANIRLKEKALPIDMPRRIIYSPFETEKIRSISKRIQDKEMSAFIMTVADALDELGEYKISHIDADCSRIESYYVPTAIHYAEIWVDMEKDGHLVGEDEKTKEEILSAMPKIEAAVQTHLKSLCEKKANHRYMDIYGSVKAMDSVMQQDGLSDNPLSLDNGVSDE